MSKTRITKRELMDFIEWAFNQTDDNMSSYSNPKIAELYMRDTGRYISVSTVRLNRDAWVKLDGKIALLFILRIPHFPHFPKPQH